MAAKKKAKKAKKKKRKKIGRPRKVIDWNVVERLCQIHCTKPEICHIIDVDKETIERACVNDNLMPFTNFYAKHCTHGKMSLRRAQFNKALAGSATMQIWLGKQWLDQKESPDEGDEESNQFTLNYSE